MVEKREKYRFPFQRDDWTEDEYISAGGGAGSPDHSNSKLHCFEVGVCKFVSSERFLEITPCHAEKIFGTI